MRRGCLPQAAPAGGSTNTTMIFGSLSEDLLRTILQKLQELYAEILTNRAAGSQASRCSHVCLFVCLFLSFPSFVCI